MRVGVSFLPEVSARMAFRNRFFAYLATSASAFILAPQALAHDVYSVGVEAFRDRYLEPGGVDVDEHSEYGSITGSYMHKWPQHAFVSAEFRGSYGSDDYKSPSGFINDIPQYETDTRVVGGVVLPFMHGTMSPFAGLGFRAFLDNNKGNVTNLNKFGYDRRIYQAYLPLGATYRFNYHNWIMAPTFEFDELLYGWVNSRLKNGGFGDDNVMNHQKAGGGFGMRGDFMVGKMYDKFGWQAGPFVRYWSIKASDIQVKNVGGGLTPLEEPKNTRLQTGLAAKILF